MSHATQELPGDALAALERGSKIEAIKHVRMERNVGLKDAKEIVEEFLRHHPEVQGRMAASSRAGAKRIVPWLFLAGAIGAAVLLRLRAH